MPIPLEWPGRPTAGTQARDGAEEVLEALANRFTKPRKICADCAYNGGIAEWVRNLRQRNPVGLEIVKCPEGVKSFRAAAKCRVVE